MVEGGVNRWCTLASRKTHPRMSLAVPSERREGMFPGLYSEIFGLSERLGCILNLGHSFDAIEACFLKALKNPPPTPGLNSSLKNTPQIQKCNLEHEAGF